MISSLKEWLAENGKTYGAFAAEIGVEDSHTVYRYVNGLRKPTPVIMEKIAAVTGGAVTANDFYGLTQGGSDKQNNAT